MIGRKIDAMRAEQVTTHYWKYKKFEPILTVDIKTGKILLNKISLGSVKCFLFLSQSHQY